MDQPGAPLIGLYEGHDSEGDRIAFTVDPPSNEAQRVRATAAGPYSSICAPVGALVGPLFYAACGNVYPWSIEGQQWIQAKVQLSGVYVDATADRENQAAFNGTVGATAVTGGSEGSSVSHTYPTLNWHAVLVNPAAVAREVGDEARIRDGAAMLPLRCTVKGLRSCTGRLVLRGGSAAGPTGPSGSAAAPSSCSGSPSVPRSAARSRGAVISASRSM